MSATVEVRPVKVFQNGSFISKCDSAYTYHDGDVYILLRGRDTFDDIIDTLYLDEEKKLIFGAGGHISIVDDSWDGAWFENIATLNDSSMYLKYKDYKFIQEPDRLKTTIIIGNLGSDFKAVKKYGTNIIVGSNLMEFS